jgi:uncharacterized membrane protein
VKQPRSGQLLAALLAVAGVSHLAAPKAYEGLIPAALGAPKPWVYASGAVELACAAGLAHPRTRSVAAWAAAALFVAVFPGNVTMAARSTGRSSAYRAAAHARLPAQAPLVWWAVSVARSS